MSFGGDLQHERETRGRSLESVANDTRFSLRHLLALERDSVADLPGGVFNRGILQGYCRSVGLDEELWLDRYSEQFGHREADWASFAEAVHRGRTTAPMSSGRRWLGVLGMALALAAMAWGAWRLMIRPRLDPAPVARASAQTTLDGKAIGTSLPFAERNLR